MVFIGEIPFGSKMHFQNCVLKTLPKESVTKNGDKMATIIIQDTYTNSNFSNFTICIFDDLVDALKKYKLFVGMELPSVYCRVTLYEKKVGEDTFRLPSYTAKGFELNNVKKEEKTFKEISLDGFRE